MNVIGFAQTRFCGGMRNADDISRCRLVWLHRVLVNAENANGFEREMYVDMYV